MAENNHQRTLTLRAPRGVVFDRDGRVLVENRYSLNISLVREQVSDLERSLVLLGDVTGISVEKLQEAIDDLAERQLAVTVGYLAKGLPIFDIVFSADGTFEVLEVSG